MGSAEPEGQNGERGRILEGGERVVRNEGGARACCLWERWEFKHQNDQHSPAAAVLPDGTQAATSRPRSSTGRRHDRADGQVSMASFGSHWHVSHVARVSRETESDSNGPSQLKCHTESVPYRTRH